MPVSRSLLSVRATPFALLAAMVAASALIFWETRDTVLYNDELTLFMRLDGSFDPATLLEPFNGHLIFIGSLLYEAVFSTAGPDLLLLRLLGIAFLLAAVGLLYVYLRARIGPVLALAPAIVVLFGGASWEVLLWPLASLNTGLALAAGIGALLALDRGDLKGDVIACAALVAGLASFTYVLPFLVGVALSVVLRPDRYQRAWIFLIPLTAFAAWWLWALRFDQESSLALANVWLIPSFAAESLAVVLAAVTGLSATLSGEGLNPTIQIDSGWGRPLALVAIAALALRIARGRVPAGLWVTLAVLGTYWALIALSLGDDRTPEQSRFILPGAVMLALVAGNALAGIRVPRAATIAVFAVVAVSVATGIRQLHDGGLFLRDYAQRAGPALAGIEAAGEAAPRDYEPRNDPAVQDVVPPQLPIQAGPYLDAVERFGSPAFSESELAAQPSQVREIAERVRRAALARERRAAAVSGR